MAALTMRELESQVRALLRDASPGSMSFTPEQYAKAVNYACEQCATAPTPNGFSTATSTKNTAEP